MLNRQPEQMDDLTPKEAQLSLQYLAQLNEQAQHPHTHG